MQGIWIRSQDGKYLGYCKFLEIRPFGGTEFWSIWEHGRSECLGKYSTKEKAMKVLMARLYERAEAERAAGIAFSLFLSWDFSS
jgi:hypothetical protein